MGEQTDGAIAEREQSEERSLSEIVRAGANLPADAWPAEKIAAAKSLVPEPARNPAGLIAYLKRAYNAGLDPFQGELHAWEDGGEIHFQVAREGWVKILRRDPTIANFEIGAVYEEDQFKWKKDSETGKIRVHHSGGMKRGDLLGAYCVLHMADDEPDHIVLRTLDEYDHLSWKDNWKKHPADMLTARVTSAAAKEMSEKAAGLVDEAGMEMSNAGQAMRRATSRQVEEATDGKADDLADELESREVSEDEALGREIEAEVKEAEQEQGPSPEDGPPTEEEVEDGHDVGGGESDVVEGTPPDTEAEMPDLDPCNLCGKEDFDSKRSKGAHEGAHTKKGHSIPDGYKVRRDEDGNILLIDPEGVILKPEAGSFESAESAREAARRDAEGNVEESTDSTDTSTEPSTESASESHEDEGEDEEILSGKGDPLDELSDAELISEIYAAQHELELDHDELLDAAEEVAPEKAPEEGRVAIMDLERGQRIELIKRLRQ